MLKLTKNVNIPGQDDINSEQYKYVTEEFKLRLLQFWTIYTEKIAFQMDGEMPL